MKKIVVTVILVITSVLSYAQNAPFSIWGAGLDGSTYQQSTIYSDASNGLLIEGPLNSSGTKLPITLSWRGGGSPFMINSSGYVGIGTTSPSDIFEVAKTPTSKFKVFTPSGYTYPTDFGTGVIGLGLTRADGVYTGGLYSYYSSSGDNIGIGSRSDIVFLAGSAGLGAQPEVMRIKGGGNVGIGTTSPEAVLDANGAIYSRGTPQNHGANRVALGYANGGAQIWSWGADASTKGTFDFQNRTSNGSAGGSAMFINSSGNVGIGTTSPTAAKFVLNSGVVNQNGLINGDKIGFTRTSDAAEVVYLKKTTDLGASGTANIHGYDGIIFRTTGAEVAKMAILSNGKVGIGTNSPDETLTVKGNIHAAEVKVDPLSTIPDYVFEPDYKLTSLTDLKRYVDKNHHLPEIPSAKEIEKNGIQLGDMNMKLLKKVEELTLYLIEQQKVNQSLQLQINQLKNK